MAEHIGAEILKARKRAKMTQDELSYRAGITKGYLSKIENGLDRNVGRDVLERIASILKYRLTIVKINKK